MNIISLYRSLDLQQQHQHCIIASSHQRLRLTLNALLQGANSRTDWQGRRDGAGHLGVPDDNNGTGFASLGVLGRYQKPKAMRISCKLIWKLVLLY